MADHGSAGIALMPQFACRHPRNPRNRRFIFNRNKTSFKIPANPMKTNAEPMSNRNKDCALPRREPLFTNLPRRQAGHQSRTTDHYSRTPLFAPRSDSRDTRRHSRITRFPAFRHQSQCYKHRSLCADHKSPLTNRAFFNRQPVRLEITVSHTKQRPATRFNRQLFTTLRITGRAFCIADAVAGHKPRFAPCTSRRDSHKMCGLR
jgi:hypothetical protein